MKTSGRAGGIFSLTMVFLGAPRRVSGGRTNIRKGRMRNHRQVTSWGKPEGMPKVNSSTGV
ncbi:MAG: hypothetical protein ACYCRD_07100 [Leptospirillum sp.]